MFKMLKTGVVRVLALTAVLAVMAGTFVIPAAAQVQTIEADMSRTCAPYGDTFTGVLRSGYRGFPHPGGWYPETVTFHFADGKSEDVGLMLPAFGSTANYVLADPDGIYANKGVVGITAEFDTTAYPNYSFYLGQGYPCTYTVSGQILQHGNNKPVMGAEVCVEEIGACDITAEDGTFSIPGIVVGMYTLTSDAPVYKPLETQVIVPYGGGDVSVDLVQYRGGGRN